RRRRTRSRRSPTAQGQTPSGCVFRTRCPLATAACAAAIPPMTEAGPGHTYACIHAAQAPASALPG
ncbi:MAG TPA: peptide ABC transporter ATP-binding protein, partial [Beijerinckiaceae bacterium]|nr:peptide ABC transporter ATP-binding protein [Beijerinckiaceae bacterium]